MGRIPHAHKPSFLDSFLKGTANVYSRFSNEFRLEHVLFHVTLVFSQITRRVEISDLLNICGITWMLLGPRRLLFTDNSLNKPQGLLWEWTKAETLFTWVLKLASVKSSCTKLHLFSHLPSSWEVLGFWAIIMCPHSLQGTFITSP